MATRKILVHSESGVRLERIETRSQRGATSTMYCVRTLRPNQPRMLADRAEAELAFAREVTASRLDPVIKAMLRGPD